MNSRHWKSRKFNYNNEGTLFVSHQFQAAAAEVQQAEVDLWAPPCVVVPAAALVEVHSTAGKAV